MHNIGSKLLLATKNAGKIRELKELLSDQEIEVLTPKDVPFESPEEIGTTFEENAVLKARAGVEASQLPTLADDSGLVISALGGIPGVYSARFAESRGYEAAFEELNRRLEKRQDRTAFFVCVLALVWPDGRQKLFRGEVRGIISPVPHGDEGFGYDPIFIPNGFDKTYAELGARIKQQTSHRHAALSMFLDYCTRMQ